MPARDIRVTGRPTRTYGIRDTIRDEWGTIPPRRLLLELVLFAVALVAIIVIVGGLLAMDPASAPAPS